MRSRSSCREEEPRTARVALAAGASAKLVIDAPRFVPLRGHDVQAAQRHHFVVFLIGVLLVGRIQFGPSIVAHAIELLVVREVVEVLVGHELGFVLAQPLRHLLLQALVLGHELGVAAQQNVGTAAGHVRGNCHRVLAARLRHNAGFALVILGVQHLVPDTHLFQDGRQVFALLHRDGAHQHGLPLGVVLLDFLGRVAELLHFGAVDHVRVFFADHGFVGRDNHHFQLVNLIKFRRFGFRRAGHAGQLFVHAEIVLERDRGQRLVLAAGS